MSKVKIIQIAVAGAGSIDNGNEFQELFLDDKGRIWYQETKKYGEYPAIPEYVTTWKQLELPDEPEETEKRGKP